MVIAEGEAVSSRPMPAAREPLEIIAARTLGHYEGRAAEFWEGTRDHDVSQNRAALLDAIGGAAPLRILDLGCGPGRDLAALRELGHAPVGLDGCAAFVAMARAHAGCEVLQQSFFALDLAGREFDGVFANASLFHVPRGELPRVLAALREALVPGGVLFCSNPRAFTDEVEGWQDDRYGCYLTIAGWLRVVTDAGFVCERHYLRPSDAPPARQPWLAMVCRRP